MSRVFTNSVGTRVKGAETELNLVGNTTETGTINLYETTGNGKEQISLKAPDSLEADYTLTFPSEPPSSNKLLKTDGSGTLSWSDTATIATLATNITSTANNSTDETVYLTFVDGATGTQGIETDTGLNYNPSTGVLVTTSVTGNLTGEVTGNAATATALATARTIGGVSFDGTGNINLPGVNTAGNQATSGLAGKATKLATTRAIAVAGDVTGTANFDGSAAISINTTLATDAIVASNITNANVTLSKLANMATDSFIGRISASAGVPEILSAAQARTILDISPYFYHKVYDPTSLDLDALSTSYQTLFYTNVAGSFVAQTASAMVELLTFNYTSTSNRWVYFRLVDAGGNEFSVGTTYGGNGTGTRDTERTIHYADETDKQPVMVNWLLTGLTIGNTYQITPQSKTNGTNNYVAAGGSYPLTCLRAYYLPG